MLNGQQTLDGLLVKRAELESEQPKIEAEYQRIIKLKTDLEHKLSALDVVIQLFDASEGEQAQYSGVVEQNTSGTAKIELSIAETENNSEEKSPENPDKLPQVLDFELSSNGNGHHPNTESQRRPRGLGKTAKTFFGELPHNYTKADLEKILVREHPGLNGKVNENTLSGLMRDLVDDGLAIVKSPASGTRQQVYEKV